MNTEHKTHELTVSFPRTDEGSTTKVAVISWLQEQGIESFVEGVIDDLDIDHEYVWGDPDFYEREGGDYAPIILCSFDQNYIADLSKGLSQDFDKQIQLTQIEMDTKDWQHGWKESFKPILTERFRIQATWEEVPTNNEKICIRLEPGMAFGTGQHASTQVCLKMLETLPERNFDFSNSAILDLGTGSGILAIALAKFGAVNLCGTDLDKDAMIAAKANAEMNGVSFRVEEGSLPKDCKYDLIVSNILYSVLSLMVPSLANALNPRGILILSGLIEEQADSMIRIAQQNKLALLGSKNVEGWIALMFIKENYETTPTSAPRSTQ